MKIYFDDKALRDLEAIYRWIAGDNLSAARIVDHKIREAIGRLADFPLSGRRGFGDYRELVVPRLPYVVVYEIDLQSRRIIVTQIVHMARDRGSAF